LRQARTAHYRRQRRGPGRLSLDCRGRADRSRHRTRADRRGALVGDQWVVTAAHIVSGLSASDLEIRLGISRLDDRAGRFASGVLAIHVHPGFATDNGSAPVKTLAGEDRLAGIVSFGTIGFSDATQPTRIPRDTSATLRVRLYPARRSGRFAGKLVPRTNNPASPVSVHRIAARSR
jgi:hypothetical protein